MLGIAVVLILFAWALSLSYKIGRYDGADITLLWLVKKGHVDIDKIDPPKK